MKQSSNVLETNASSMNNSVEQLIWSEANENYNILTYNEENMDTGVNSDIAYCMSDCSPFEFYELFLDSDALTLLVSETNRYAEQRLL